LIVADDARGRQSPAEREFSVALRDLHLHAGEPSSREVARAIGGMSHTTVNLALRGTKVPSWPVAVKLVQHLGGDVEHFRQLWVETRESAQATQRLSQPDVSVFVSYARIDDRATYHRVSQLVDDIANTYRSMTGQDVAVFQDIDTIKPGDDWKDRIRLGLSSSSIMLAFVSPAYLGSAPCREELSEFLAFLDANSSERLVIPLLFADPDRIEYRFVNDDLWVRLKTLNRVDISELRSADPGTSQWIVKVEKIAKAIDEVLEGIEKQPDPSKAGQQGPSLVTAAEERPEGILERLAATEKAMPGINDNIERLATLLQQVGERAVATTPKMERADTFGKKLAASRELAAQLAPIAAEITRRADQIVSDFNDIDDFVINILNFSRSTPVEIIKDPQNVAGFKAIWGLATIAAASIRQLEEFNETLAQVIGFSADLDRPLKAMRGAFLRMADIRGILNVWLDELRTLQSTYPDILVFEADA
jgi:hypothetical protein